VPLYQISDDYFVSPQITSQDIDDIRAAGITTVICNRPDGENPPQNQAAAIQTEVEAAGLQFFAVPFDQQTLTADVVSRHRDALTQADGPVLAYCASGNRSTIVWALGQAEIGAQSADTMIAAAAQAGYNLEGLRPTLTAMVAQAQSKA